MFRVLVFVYGLACYAAFVASFALFALFLSGDAGGRTVDSGAVGPVRLALAADVALIALFGVPHSVMARASFKRRWTRLVPVALERSTYVLVSSVLLLALVRLWRPVPAVLWSAESPAAAGAARALFWGGLALTVAATFAFSHAELAGLDRVWAYLRRRERMGSTFRTPPLYRAVRHPMQLGVLLAVWATPVLTVGRLVLAAGLTAYVLVGLWFEERDLVRAFGAEYEAYRRRVPQLVPGVASLRALAHAARRVRAAASAMRRSSAARSSPSRCA
jgi:protein-S-isoprenylcysteine O-methyltransferase Ste14